MRADPNWKAKAVSPDDAVSCIKSGMRVFIHGAAATPTPLLKALCNRPDLRKALANIRHFVMG
jgi:acyl-CoA hydrolase